MSISTINLVLSNSPVKDMEAPDFVSDVDYVATSGLILCQIPVTQENIAAEGQDADNQPVKMSNLIVTAVNAENEETVLYTVPDLVTDATDQKAGTFQNGRITWDKDKILIYLDLEGDKGVSNQKTITVEYIGKKNDKSNILVTSRKELDIESLKEDENEPILYYPITRSTTTVDMNRDRVKTLVISGCTSTAHKFSANIICTNVTELGGERNDLVRSATQCQTLTQLVGKPNAAGTYTLHIGTKKDMMDSMNIPSADHDTFLSELAEKGEYLIEISDDTVGTVNLPDGAGGVTAVKLCLANQEDLVGTALEGKRMVCSLQAMDEVFSNKKMIVGEKKSLGGFEHPKNKPENLPLDVSMLSQTDHNKVTFSFKDDAADETKDSNAGKQHRQNIVGFGDNVGYKIRVYSETSETVETETVVTEHNHFVSALIPHGSLNGFEFELADVVAGDETIGYAFTKLNFELETLHTTNPAIETEQTTISDFKVVGKLYGDDLLPNVSMSQKVVRKTVNNVEVDTDTFDVNIPVDPNSGVILTDSFCDNNRQSATDTRDNLFDGWVRTIVDDKTKYEAVNSSYKATTILVHFPQTNIGLTMHAGFEYPTRTDYLAINQLTYVNTLTRFNMSVVQSLTSTADQNNNWEIVYSNPDQHGKRTATGKLTFDATVGDGQIIEASLIDRHHQDENGAQKVIYITEVLTTADAVDSVEFTCLPVNVRMGVSISVRDRDDKNNTTVSTCTSTTNPEDASLSDFSLLKVATVSTATGGGTIEIEYTTPKITLTSSLSAVSCTVTKLVNPGVKSFDTLVDMEKDDIMVIDVSVTAKSLKDADGQFTGQTSAVLSWGQNSDMVPTPDQPGSKYEKLMSDYSSITVPAPRLEGDLSYQYRCISSRIDDSGDLEVMEAVIKTLNGGIQQDTAKPADTTVKYYRFMTNEDLAEGDRLTSGPGNDITNLEARLYQDETGQAAALTIDGEQVKVTLSAELLVDGKLVSNTPLHVLLKDGDNKPQTLEEISDDVQVSKVENPARACVLNTYGAEIDVSTECNVYCYDHSTAASSKLSIARTDESIAASLAKLADDADAAAQAAAVNDEDATNDTHATVGFVTCPNIRIEKIKQNNVAVTAGSMFIVASVTEPSGAITWDSSVNMLNKIFKTGSAPLDQTTLTIQSVVERRNAAEEKVEVEGNVKTLNNVDMKYVPDTASDDTNATKITNEILEPFSTLVNGDDSDAFLSAKLVYSIQEDDGFGTMTTVTHNMTPSKKLAILNVGLLCHPKIISGKAVARSVAFQLEPVLTRYSIKDCTVEATMKDKDGNFGSIDISPAAMFSHQLDETYEKIELDETNYLSGMKECRFTITIPGAVDHTTADVVEEKKEENDVSYDVMNLFKNELVISKEVYVFNALTAGNDNDLKLLTGNIETAVTGVTRPARLIVVGASQVTNECDFQLKMKPRNQSAATMLRIEAEPVDLEDLRAKADAHGALESALTTLNDATPALYKTGDNARRFHTGFFTAADNTKFKERNGQFSSNPSILNVPYTFSTPNVHLTMGKVKISNGPNSFVTKEGADANMAETMYNDAADDDEVYSFTNTESKIEYTTAQSHTVQGEGQTVTVNHDKVWEREWKTNAHLAANDRLAGDDGNVVLNARLYEHHTSGALTLKASITTGGVTTENIPLTNIVTEVVDETKTKFIVETNGQSNICVSQVFKSTELTADWIAANPGSTEMVSEPVKLNIGFHNKNTVTRFAAAAQGESQLDISESGYGNVDLASAVYPSLRDTAGANRGIVYTFPDAVVTKGAANATAAITPAYQMEYRESVTDDWKVQTTKDTGSALPWDKTQMTVQMFINAKDVETLGGLGRGKDGVPMSADQITTYENLTEAERTWDNLPNGLGTADENENTLIYMQQTTGADEPIMTTNTVNSEAGADNLPNQRAWNLPYVGYTDDQGNALTRFKAILSCDDEPAANAADDAAGKCTLRSWCTKLKTEVSAKQDDVRYDHTTSGFISAEPALTKMYPSVIFADIPDTVNSTAATVGDVTTYAVTTNVDFYMTSGFTDPDKDHNWANNDDAATLKNTSDESERLQTIFIVQNNIERAAASVEEAKVLTTAEKADAAWAAFKAKAEAEGVELTDIDKSHMRKGTMASLKFFKGQDLDENEDLDSTWVTNQNSTAYANVMVVLLAAQGGATCESAKVTLKRDQTVHAAEDAYTDGSESGATVGSLVYKYPAKPTKNANGGTDGTDLYEAIYVTSMSDDTEDENAVAGEETLKTKHFIKRNVLEEVDGSPGTWQKKLGDDSAVETEIVELDNTRVFEHSVSITKDHAH